MTRRELAGLVACAALAWPWYAFGEPAAGKPILIGAHLDQAKQASYYSLLQKDSIDLFGGACQHQSDSGLNLSTGHSFIVEWNITPAARKIAFRSQRMPKSRSSRPIASCRRWRGTRLSSGPSATTRRTQAAEGPRMRQARQDATRERCWLQARSSTLLQPRPTKRETQPSLPIRDVNCCSREPLICGFG